MEMDGWNGVRWTDGNIECVSIPNMKYECSSELVGRLDMIWRILVVWVISWKDPGLSFIQCGRIQNLIGQINSFSMYTTNKHTEKVIIYIPIHNSIK